MTEGFGLGSSYIISMKLVKAARRQRELLIQCDLDRYAQCFIRLRRLDRCPKHLKVGPPKLKNKHSFTLELNKARNCVKCRKDR
jgi:hypothetical protein